MKSIALVCFISLLISAQVTATHKNVALNQMSRQALPCNNMCNFRLCFNVLRPTELVIRPDGAPNKLRGEEIPMGGEFCTISGAQLFDVKIREAFVAKPGSRYRKISSFKPKNLFARYPKDYFIVIGGEAGTQRIGRILGQGNQGKKLNDLCVRIPLKSYRLSESGPRTSVSGDKNCISMQVREFLLQFELQWDNSDDFDLSVSEPGPFGETLSRTNQRSFYGGAFSTDNNIAKCSRTPIANEFSRETVQYALGSGPPEGAYTVSVIQYNSCERSNANYVLRAIVNGKIVATRTGVVLSGSEETVTETFNIMPLIF